MSDMCETGCPGSQSSCQNAGLRAAISNPFSLNFWTSGPKGLLFVVGRPMPVSGIGKGQFLRSVLAAFLSIVDPASPRHATRLLVNTRWQGSSHEALYLNRRQHPLHELILSI